uniref:PDZ domain-containing protein n=1 Tax=Parascaris univalens TaxID=6257 RepID=A0A914ZRR9_PARUN
MIPNAQNSSSSYVHAGSQTHRSSIAPKRQKVAMHEYEEVNLDEQFCVATQTDPVSSDEEDRQISEHMDDCFEGECELNALEYEEVVLKRSSSCHRLGLTLCYGATDDNDTDIFISEIESGSIADRDGRLRAGDQILQVNGEAIHSRLDAIEQFRSNRREISILLARTPQSEEGYEVNFDRNTGAGICTALHEDDKGAFTDANSVNSAFEKDSGLSRMTDSDAEILPPPIDNPNSSPLNSSSKGVDANVRKIRRCGSDASLERELASLHREMETIRLECDRLISKHNSAERRVAQQVAKANSLMNTIGELSRGSEMQRRTDDTSSAYNTGGESCRSTPLKSEYPRPVSCKNSAVQACRGSAEHVYHQLDVTANYEALSQLPSTSQPHVKFRLPQYSVVLRESNFKKKSAPSSSSRKESSSRISYKPGDTMYTSPDKLAETIALQQRLLRQAMIEQANMLKPHSGCNEKNGEPFEWKIKRRSDGTRYITKRPIRNRLLKEREEQLNKERTGISTDDDAMSELKTGRFWSREERKKHLERAKERKMRQHQMLAERQQRPSDQMIVQLSHKKMMQKKGQMLFDKFTTIQEFLAHGNRDPSNRTNEGILSVTTV